MTLIHRTQRVINDEVHRRPRWTIYSESLKKNWDDWLSEFEYSVTTSVDLVIWRKGDNIDELLAEK